ncbi:MAG TPA: carboxylating nicotinate-nucleotide diphosphorylase [Acidimicrobiales bacterium]|jgi:nicotinate-nucleotide pyrophosphorylase (carboxylating)|nr:carboxylating nicotinate-nucleotide diphosphorylase [Acidimicrobiales bacterium]
MTVDHDVAGGVGVGVGAGLEDPSRFDPPQAAVVEAVRIALAEDLLPLGDLTAALVSASVIRSMAVVSRRAGVVAGRACAVETLAQIDPSIRVEWRMPDGSAVVPGSTVAVLTGPLRSILTAERTALNFLGHLSGIATLTASFVAAVTAANPGARVLDTRKTTPGLRSLEKAAVRAGGGTNHRGSLSDAVLVKDNHLGGVTITEAVVRARRLWPGRMVEVECDRDEQVTEAVAVGATVVMLDNMTPEQVTGCVAQVRASGTATLVEVSGGVDLATAPRYAAAGADLISVGALTHSAPLLDLGLDLMPDAGGRH